MNKSICQVSVAPLRKTPSDTSEMVSQLLFGELCEVMEIKKNWVFIKVTYDDYEGWIDHKQIAPINDISFSAFKHNTSFVSEAFNIFILDEKPFPITIGAEVHNIQNNLFELNPDKKFEVDGCEFSDLKLNKQELIELSFKYINTPYLWGGKSTFGIDCSGFTQMVYKIAGYFLPRDASEQALVGEVLGFIEESEPGDLAFFENEDGKIIHVGIILSDNKIIHAHGKVRIDNLDYNGIFNSELNRYTHQLRFVRKIF